jgi:RHS repeat-associated protein
LNRSYDANRGWMTGLTVQNAGNSVVNQNYVYNPAGQLTTATDNVSPTLTASYGYDYLGRLTTASTSNWGLQWSYDDFGNRLTQSATAGSPPTSSLSYDVTSNRITAGGYSYDNNGNLTAFPGPAGNTSISYDAFDRATTITVASSSSTVNYDAFGRRVQKTFAGGMQRLYFYSANGQLLAEYDSIAAGASPSRTTAYFAGQRVGQWTDRVGSKRADSGSASQYYPYGEEITGTANDTYKFARTYRDSDSGLDYAHNRYYSSGIARFMTPDPAQGTSPTNPDAPQSWNRYAYVHGDPVNFTDLRGLGEEKAEEPPLDCDPDPGHVGDPDSCYAVAPGGTTGGPPAAAKPVDTSKAINAADKLMDKKRCASFVYAALEGAFLAENNATSVDQLDQYQQGLFGALGTGAVKAALNGATFVASPASPTTAVNGTTYTTIAQTAGSALGNLGVTITLFSGYFNESGSAQALTMIHEGMHAVNGASDVNFAQALGVYTPGMTQAQASAAWDAKLKANCDH